MKIPTKQLFNNFLIVMGVVAVCIVVYLLFITTSIAKPILAHRAKSDLSREFAPVNAVLRDYNISVTYEPAVHCDNIDGDRSGDYGCSQLQDWQRDINKQFVADWNSIYPKLEQALTNNGWTKELNRDPVTKDPVDSLKDLLRYEGQYDANVNYSKRRGDVDCNVRFTVTPVDRDTTPARFEASEVCNSTFR